LAELAERRPLEWSKIAVTMRRLLLGFLLAALTGWACSQVDQLPRAGKTPGKNQTPPHSDPSTQSGESSSRDTRIDLSPPENDAKDHPASTVPAPTPEGDVEEFHPWDPHRALKDIEVGDFYLKRKNYRAALDRYQEALLYKPGDAIAHLRMGQCYEKLDQPEQAAKHYGEYLKILPDGPFSEEAKKGLERVKTEGAKSESALPDKP
jgi:tetratricopeptide (TPR) repeat protein